MRSPANQPEDLIRLVALGKPLFSSEREVFERVIRDWLGYTWAPTLSIFELASAPFAYLTRIFRTELGFSRPELAAAVCLMPSGWDAFTYKAVGGDVRVQVTWEGTKPSREDVASVYELWHFVRAYWQGTTGAKRRELGVTEVDALIARFLEAGA